MKRELSSPSRRDKKLKTKEKDGKNNYKNIFNFIFDLAIYENVFNDDCKMMSYVMWILVIRLRDFKLRFLFHTKHSYQSSANLLFSNAKKHSPIPPCICLYAFLAANKKN